MESNTAYPRGSVEEQFLSINAYCAPQSNHTGIAAKHKIFILEEKSTKDKVGYQNTIQTFAAQKRWGVEKFIYGDELFSAANALLYLMIH